ncbi:ribonucleotide reductase small subunit homolog [Lymantria dispar multiple nucleopolyhedrovirus]|uniref:Ribonucleotide reductase small subunit homolog n=1 Tax=Lymantria dispar multicapsid nuclear polyhedrosis virus TaxID=10449 RepID=Q9YMI0_NPVLD|nr:ribonucleotide reductase small subunit homolog [Lymantria dispar multiple nucleopolyhedrovirus]AAC70334.1 ribonucleotide reductase small subunit homolog [Lymantria dispar multiple nucleopolyhedrovirus]
MRRIDNLQTSGRNVLASRMMRAGETPAEFCARMARKLAGGHPTKSELMKSLLESVALVPSSAVCADGTDSSSACHLTVFGRSYAAAVKLEELNRAVAMCVNGTGVGIGADNLRYQGSAVAGELKNNFVEICQYIDGGNKLSVAERKSRTALFLSLHNINSLICLTLRQQNARVTPNVFYGLMIPDLFIEAQRRDADASWYFFDGHATLDGASLNECYGREYEDLYARMVEAKLYLKKMNARRVLGEIIMCIAENGFPYVVWRDRVNEYNNQKRLGVVQTLNLCTEICQHADSGADSMCTLLTVNAAAYCEDYDRAAVFREIEADLAAHGMLECMPPFGGNELFAHCFATAYMATFALNVLLGETARREIGVTPTGLFDAVYIMCGREAAYDAMPECAAAAAEYIYMGCVLSSIAYSRAHGVVCRNFAKSEFSRGLLQFDLRRVAPALRWDAIRPHMMRGMANSMLTAQAPTATTSLLTNVTESVQYPMAGAAATTKNSGIGRFAETPFFLLRRREAAAAGANKFVSIEKQVEVYERTAPFVDQSQSVIISCKATYEDVFRVLRRTFDAKLKTAIYYLMFTTKQKYLDMSSCDACAQ